MQMTLKIERKRLKRSNRKRSLSFRAKTSPNPPLKWSKPPKVPSKKRKISNLSQSRKKKVKSRFSH